MDRLNRLAGHLANNRYFTYDVPVEEIPAAHAHTHTHTGIHARRVFLMYLYLHSSSSSSSSSADIHVANTDAKDWKPPKDYSQYSKVKAQDGYEVLKTAQHGSLKHKTLFISGASRGIGLSIALRAARDGANIW